MLNLYIRLISVLPITFLTFFVNGAIAQTMYKCGTTFSQTPCDKTSAATKMRGDAPASPPPGLHGKELCAAAVLRQSVLKDPYSARIEGVAGPFAETVMFADKPLLVKRYDVAVNAKNSYGAYTGAKIIVCQLNEDNARVFDINVPASQ